MRSAFVPEEISQDLSAEWASFSSQRKKSIAEAILKISDHFQNPLGLNTPWNEENAFDAYKFYFFPLNLARGAAVFKELQKIISEPLSHLYDIGAGLGNLELLQKNFPEILRGPITNIEVSDHPKLREKLKTIPDTLPKNSTGFFSFSWVETKTQTHMLNLFEHLIFIEPSTSVIARKLMVLRGELIKIGFRAIAPCTHEQGCPLLLHSKKDWCHDRVHFNKPDWIVELERLLPMKNDTLTYSYLVMSKSLDPKALGKVRVIGDTLKEKGKTKQAICFDDQRRFLSWLKKDHDTIEQLDHGALIDIRQGLEKNSEIRVTPESEIIHIE